MVRSKCSKYVLSGLVTEGLIRKRAEHNEGEIFSLEELTLHQQDIERTAFATRIEFLDKHCRKLKILYLQSNLISRIENLNRLKELEYLNLALNNIEVIENLEGCESLTKLDLTVNFIGDLTSVENLQNLENLRDLYLIGNPCADYEGYREFVIATLPQLKSLDGTEIGKAERIVAFQNLHKHYKTILKCQKKHFEKREREKEESAVRKEVLARRIEKCNGDLDAINEEFWQEKQAYTPESRLETHEFIQLKKKQHTKEIGEDRTKKSKRTVFFTSDGRPYNINEPKHMDTTLIDCDVQATYVRVTLKSKVFQMALPSEIHPDRAKVTRSQITGRLLMQLPKVQWARMQLQQNPDPKKEEVIALISSTTYPAGAKTDEGAISTNINNLGLLLWLMGVLTTTANVRTLAPDQIENKPSPALPPSSTGPVYRRRMIPKGETPPSSSSSIMTEDIHLQSDPFSMPIRKP
ncbi:unnamed protein product [Schistocephalus solidus]|uniref:LRRcap domain-containing protein n=1 Tax=Schistocephalus solidus TaxID=70667 RepID=A0A183SW76_SCHSO|nr:unnamed protein product [Schistocephalus solidus]